MRKTGFFEGDCGCPSVTLALSFSQTAAPAAGPQQSGYQGAEPLQAIADLCVGTRARHHSS